MPVDAVVRGSAASSPAPMVPVRYRVVDRTVETQDTVTLGLVPCDEPIADPVPGQFSMMYAFGGGEAAISVSGCPREDSPLRHTIRAGGPGTRALCDVEPGTTVGVRGPFGVGWPLATAEGADVLVIGGGIGLAPLRPVVHQFLRDRARYGRVAVLVGARRPVDVPYRDELEAWGRRGDISVAICVDVPDRGWQGDVGVVSDLLGRVSFAPDRAVAYVCGPEVMMRVIAVRLLDGGLDPQRVFISLERNMQCAIAHCGHCQLGPMFVCADGPVVSWDRAAPLLAVRQW
jgi:NAD(P)H-flavin reductase